MLPSILSCIWSWRYSRKPVTPVNPLSDEMCNCDPRARLWSEPKLNLPLTPGWMIVSPLANECVILVVKTSLSLPPKEVPPENLPTRVICPSWSKVTCPRKWLRSFPILNCPAKIDQEVWPHISLHSVDRFLRSAYQHCQFQIIQDERQIMLQ